MTHTGLKGSNEWAIALRLQCAGRKCSQTPILPIRVEQIGWRADLQTTEHVVLMGPSVTACGTHPNREVRDQTNRHSCSPCLSLRAGEGAVSEPLQKTMKQDLASVLCGKLSDGCTAWIAPNCRPLVPVRLLRIGFEPGLMQGFKQRMLLKRRAAIATKRAEISCETDGRICGEISSGKVFEQMAQDRYLCSRRCFPIDEG